MGAFSDYLEEDILKSMFNNLANNVQQATVYVALFTAAPDDTAGSGTEVTGSNYARQAVTCNTSNWTVNAIGNVVNNADISWTAATTPGFGTVVAFGIFDALTAGNCLFYGNLTTNQTIGTGAVAKFVAGQLSITLD